MLVLLKLICMAIWIFIIFSLVVASGQMRSATGHPWFIYLSAVRRPGSAIAARKRAKKGPRAYKSFNPPADQ